MSVTSPNQQGGEATDSEVVWMLRAGSAILLMCPPYQGDDPQYLLIRRHIVSSFAYQLRSRCAIRGYVEQRLSPSLKAGQIVILDNLSIHLGPKVRQAIQARGCRLLFLPTSSPDFSPIEEAFSKVKTFLRRQQARTREAERSALAQALALITETDALGWFTHCGYPPPVLDERAL